MFVACLSEDVLGYKDDMLKQMESVSANIERLIWVGTLARSSYFPPSVKCTPMKPLSK